MRWLDTNVLLRWILEDDLTQAHAVERLFHQASIKGERFFVTDLVLAELSWVLLSQGKPRVLVARTLAHLADEELFEFENRHRWVSVAAILEGNDVDLVDAYLAVCAQDQGDGAVVSFDRDFARLPVKWVEPK